MILKQLIKYKLLEYSIDIFFNNLNNNFLNPVIIKLFKGDVFKEIISNGKSFKDCVIVKNIGNKNLFNENFNLFAFKSKDMSYINTAFLETCRFIK